MGIQAPPYSLRLDSVSMEKIRALAKQGRRSVNMQLCIAVESYLEQYEREYGPIPVEPEDT